MNMKPFFIMLGLVLASSQALNAMDINRQLLEAAKVGGQKRVGELLGEGAKVYTVDKNGNTPLHFAAKGGHKEVVQMLINQGADCKAANVDDNTPLHMAALKGDEEIVEKLLGQDAKVNVANRAGDTPLHKAAEKGNNEVVQILLGKGANPFVKNKRGWTALDAARDSTGVELEQRRKMVRILAFNGLAGNLECPICLDEKPKAEMVVLPCGHYICRECLLNLQRRRDLSCPTCRARFRQTDVM